MASDIQSRHVIFRYAPPAWHPYLRLARVDRPTGTWLLLLPCWWSLVLAHHGVMNMVTARAWLHVFLFALGALLMRSAGCVINDLWDRDLDRSVARTKTRPLAAGEIMPMQAMLFLGGLLLASFLVLLSFGSFFATVLGIAALVPVAVYPLMKRVTWWPQLFLGFTFNWGALMGFAVTQEKLTFGALALYAGGIFWTLAYDTIYAQQDKEDDETVGIRSTALLFGDKSKQYVTWFFAAALLLLAVAKFASFPSFMTPLFLFPVVLHAVWQIRTWDVQKPESSLGVFRSNAIFGALVLLMLSV